MQFTCVYLAWRWRPVGGVPSGGRGRSARHCMWSEGWGGERHGTAGPPAPYLTAKHRGKNWYCNNFKRDWGIQTKNKWATSHQSWAPTSDEVWIVYCRIWGRTEWIKKGVGRDRVWVRAGENEKQGGREGGNAAGQRQTRGLRAEDQRESLASE